MVAPQPPPPALVWLAPGVEAALVEALVEAGGVEPCGYLVGRRRDDGIAVHAFEPGTNVHPTPRTAFALEPHEHLAVRRRARAQGLEIVGFGHGHLAGDARPSRADLAGLGAYAPPWMLIAGRDARGAIRVRGWCAARGEALEARTLNVRA